MKNLYKNHLSSKATVHTQKDEPLSDRLLKRAGTLVAINNPGIGAAVLAAKGIEAAQAKSRGKAAKKK